MHADGHLSVIDTPFLAGAGHLLDWSIAHFISFVDCTLAAALILCTENPARLFGLGSGRLEKGTAANITTFRFVSGSERLSIDSTWRMGRQVYPARAEPKVIN